MTSRSPEREELANTITHGIGLVASIAGGAVLITYASFTRDPWQLLAALIYILSLVVLYAASTAYHAARDPIVKARLKVVDHCAIFGLIAGSYTPFTLGGMRGGIGWSLFVIAWTLAVGGIVYKLFLIDRFPRLSVLLYLGMGWMVVFAIRPMQIALPGALPWIAAGGILYTVGTIFYVNRRMPYAHAVWHLFVIGGSVCHFVAVLTQLLPDPPT